MCSLKLMFLGMLVHGKVSCINNLNVLLGLKNLKIYGGFN